MDKTLKGLCVTQQEENWEIPVSCREVTNLAHRSRVYIPEKKNCSYADTNGCNSDCHFDKSIQQGFQEGWYDLEPLVISIPHGASHSSLF